MSRTQKAILLELWLMGSFFVLGAYNEGHWFRIFPEKQKNAWIPVIITNDMLGYDASKIFDSFQDDDEISECTLRIVNRASEILTEKAAQKVIATPKNYL